MAGARSIAIRYSPFAIKESKYVRTRQKIQTTRPVQQAADADEQAAQRDAAFAAIRRLYGEALPLRRSCRRGTCRRHKACSGDVRSCLARGWPHMPPELQIEAHHAVMRGGPRRLPPATHTEWRLRRFPPSNFVG